MAGRLAGGDLGARGRTWRGRDRRAGAQLQHHGGLPGAEPCGAGRLPGADRGRGRPGAAAHRARPARRRPAAAGVAGADLRAAETACPRPARAAGGAGSGLAEGLAGALEELRELSRGIHPAILSEGGLARAQGARPPLGRPGRADVRSRATARAVEVAAYYVVSEALANAAKHAQASACTSRLGRATAAPRCRSATTASAAPTGRVRAQRARDRVEALGGTIEVHSPAGQGTSLQIDLPIQDRPGDLG